MARNKPASQPTPVRQSRDKREAFVRLATKRTQAALKRIRMLRPLANRSQYDYTDEDVEKILAALGEAVVHVETAFSQRVVKEEGFTL